MVNVFLSPTHPLIPQPTPISTAIDASYHLLQGAHLPEGDFSWLEKRICMWIGLFRHITCRVKSSSKSLIPFLFIPF